MDRVNWALLTLIAMMFMHVVDDYYLQGCLAKMKQKKWWMEECKNQNLNFSNYENDYRVALVIHGFSWACCVHLPILICMICRHNINSIFIFISILVNALIHSIIDDLKANKLKINLGFDQGLHFSQLMMIFILYFYILF